MKFHGSDYREDLDYDRLKKQIDKIYFILSNGDWYTYAEIAEMTGYPENSISAQIRNLRKPENGGCTIIRRNRNGIRGLSEYKLELKTKLAPISITEDHSGQLSFDVASP